MCVHVLMCARWRGEFYRDAPQLKTCGSSQPKAICSLTEHMSVSRDCRQSKRDGTEEGL